MYPASAIYPVYPISPYGTPTGLAGHYALPPSPYSHAHGLPPYGYAAPAYHHGQSPLYGDADLPALAGYPSPGAMRGGVSQIHGLLQYSRNPRLLFDLAKPINSVRLANGAYIPPEQERAPATMPHSAQIRIVCSQLPWYIDIDASEGAGYASTDAIVISTLLSDIHAALRRPVTHSEWLIAEKRKREAVGLAFKRRAENTGRQEYDEGVKRIDWLEKSSYFFGLTKDERVVKEILQGRAAEVPETWVMIVGSR